MAIKTRLSTPQIKPQKSKPVQQFSVQQSHEHLGDQHRKHHARPTSRTLHDTEQNNTKCSTTTSTAQLSRFRPRTARPVPRHLIFQSPRSLPSVCRVKTTLTGSDRRRSIRHSTPSVPPRLIREDGFVTSEHNPTDSSPSTPIPSSSRPRPRRPSLSDFDYADMCLRYHYWTPHGYLPRTYISEELCMAMLIPASSLFFLLLWYPEPATAIPISLTALAITLWASYEYFIGRPCF